MSDIADDPDVRMTEGVIHYRSCTQDGLLYYSFCTDTPDNRLFVAEVLKLDRARRGAAA